jgi:hypothetical protein
MGENARCSVPKKGNAAGFSVPGSCFLAEPKLGLVGRFEGDLGTNLGKYVSKTLHT